MTLPFSNWSISVFGISILVLSFIWWSIVGAYRLLSSSSLAEGKLKLKKLSWILTGITSLLMTLGSVPFVMDYSVHGLDVGMISERQKLSEGIVAVFLSYLVLDCTYGFIYYRSQFKVLTGWVHHSAYSILLLFILANGSCHVFSAAAIMELPTLLLSLGMIFPQTRNDYTFNATFFVTRIILHSLFLVQFATPYGRLNGPRLSNSQGELIESFVPLIGFLSSAPLHIMWFYSSMKSLLKKTPPIVVVVSTTKLSPTLLLNRPKFTTLASTLLKTPRPLLTQRRRLLRMHLEKEVKQFFDKSREWRETIGELLENGINVDDLLRETNVNQVGEDSDSGGEVLKTMGRLRRDERMKRLGGRVTRRAREVLTF